MQLLSLSIKLPHEISMGLSPMDESEDVVNTTAKKAFSPAAMSLHRNPSPRVRGILRKEDSPPRERRTVTFAEKLIKSPFKKPTDLSEPKAPVAGKRKREDEDGTVDNEPSLKKAKGASTDSAVPPDGFGKLQMANGAIVEGLFRNGRLDPAVGHITFKDGLTYEGQIECGGPNEYYAEGTGVLTLLSGETHVGLFHKGVPHGPGKLVYQGKTIIESDFVNGTFGAITKIALQDGMHYEGEITFDPNMPYLPPVGHGQGRICDQTGELIYKGGFSFGLFEGSGKLVSPPGLEGAVSLQGEFSKGVLKGEGTVYFADGSIYKGTLEAVLRKENMYEYLLTGKGTFIMPNQDVYLGFFKKGKRHGSGTLVENGKTYDVTYVNDRRIRWQEVRNG